MAKVHVSIAGLTGKMARLISSHLLENPQTIIHGIARSPDRLPTELASNPRVKIFKATSSDSDVIRQAVRGTSVCICAYLGDNSVLVDGQKTLIDACIEEKVPRYIASDYSFDFRSLALGEIPVKDFQLKTDTYLKEKESKGLIKGVHIINGAFMEVLFAPFFGLYQPDTPSLKVYGDGKEILEMTTYADAAKFTAQVALNPRASGFLTVLGDRKTAAEMAQAYEKVYASELKVENQGSLNDLLNEGKRGKQEQPTNVFAWAFKLLFYRMLDGTTFAHEEGQSPKADFRPKDLEAFFRAHPKENLSSAVKI